MSLSQYNNVKAIYYQMTIRLLFWRKKSCSAPRKKMNLVKARLICESLEGVLHSINPGQVQCVFLGQGGTFTTVFRTDRTMATCARLPTFCFDQSQQRMKMSSSPCTLFSPADSYYLDNWHRSDVRFLRGGNRVRLQLFSSKQLCENAPLFFLPTNTRVVHFPHSQGCSRSHKMAAT